MRGGALRPLRLLDIERRQQQRPLSTDVPHLSAIYCYYDPRDRVRSLGTFNILSLLASARERGLPHVYLGYCVAGCRSREYKRKFRPNEVLRPNGTWEAFDVK